jgi:hypothetical protein
MEQDYKKEIEEIIGGMEWRKKETPYDLPQT